VSEAPEGMSTGGGRPKGSRSASTVLDAVSFEEPPQTTRVRRARTSSNWSKQAESLKENPGQWGHVSLHDTEDSAKQAASGIRNGNRKGFVKGDFEASFAPHPAEEGKFGVWARFTGAGDGGAATDTYSESSTAQAGYVQV
jgi:hypothetical protein